MCRVWYRVYDGVEYMRTMGRWGMVVVGIGYVSTVGYGKIG